MKTYIDKIIEFVKQGNIFVILLLCLLTGFIIPLWISIIIATIVFIFYFFSVIYSNTNNINKSVNEKNSIDNTKSPTQWCYIDKSIDYELRVGVFYDNFDGSYRIIEINSNLIFEEKFFSTVDAMEFIKEQAKDGYVLGINEYNCIGNLIKK